jgi:hypothetical protein
MATPTPTQDEANQINHNLYNGLPPPTLASDGSPLDPNSTPGQASVTPTAPPAAHAPAHTPPHRATTHETHRERK